MTTAFRENGEIEEVPDLDDEAVAHWLRTRLTIYRLIIGSLDLVISHDLIYSHGSARTSSRSTRSAFYGPWIVSDQELQATVAPDNNYAWAKPNSVMALSNILRTLVR